MNFSGTGTRKYFFKARRFFAAAAVLLFCIGGAAAQEAEPSKLFQAKVIAAGAVKLRAETATIELWGVMPVEGASARQRMTARTTLDNLVGNAPVQCEMKGRSEAAIRAQCVNSGDIDLGLYMLQSGLAMADRAMVYGTAFEEPYLEAERNAQERSAGMWAETGAGGDTDSGLRGLVMAALGLSGLAVAMLFVVLVVAIRGFKTIASGQDRSMDFMNKERELKNRERKVVAAMLDAELRANKSKIEAYLVIYEEMLKNLSDPGKAAQYTKSGDIVQMQPALDRSVFDRNTDKMDLMGRKLSSEVIHFYARIKSSPDYVNLEPDMPQQQALETVDQAVKNARNLDDVLKKLLESFAKAGLGQTSD